MKRTANISYKMQVNLNQIARLANIHDLPFVMDAIREYINRTNEYFKTGTWREMDLSAYEFEQKQREQLVAKIRELQEKNTELQKAATNYSFILPRVNAFSASGTTAGFIQTTEASTGISRSPIIQLIYFRMKSAGLTSIMRFQ